MKCLVVLMDEYAYRNSDLDTGQKMMEEQMWLEAKRLLSEGFNVQVTHTQQRVLLLSVGSCLPKDCYRRAQCECCQHSTDNNTLRWL